MPSVVIRPRAIPHVSVRAQPAPHVTGLTQVGPRGEPGPAGAVGPSPFGNVTVRTVSGAGVAPDAIVTITHGLGAVPSGWLCIDQMNQPYNGVDPWQYVDFYRDTACVADANILQLRPFAPFETARVMIWTATLSGNPPAGGGAGGSGIESRANKRMVARETTADGQLACAIALAGTPVGYVSVRLNGVDLPELGDGTTVDAVCYFSADGGQTARAWSAITQGDTLHWQGSVAGFELAATDTFDFLYET